MTDHPAPETARSPAAGRLFGPLALIQGENTASYQELLEAMSSTLKPADIFEEVLTREIAEITWDAFRLRRMKANSLRGATGRALRIALEPLLGEEESGAISWDWSEGKQAAIESVDAAFASAGVAMELALAPYLSPFSCEIADADRIDRMVTRLEARRKAALQEFERHRENLAPKLGRASEPEGSA
jgi:hypothetical protein